MLVTCPECKAQISSKSLACPRCGVPYAQAAPGAGTAHPVAARATPNATHAWVAAIGLLGAAFIGVLTWVLVAKKEPRAEAAPTAAPATPPVMPAPAPTPASPGNNIIAAKSYADAIARAKPLMADSANDVDPATAFFTVWASTGMRFADVSVAQDETTVALVMKDPDSERGKRLCGSGSLIEIATEKLESGAKAYNGLLHTYAGNLIRFFAVGSTGVLVANSDARFCGVVSGKFDYSNSAGGTGHAVTMVGMFDLPQNRQSAAK